MSKNKPDIDRMRNGRSMIKIGQSRGFYMRRKLHKKSRRTGGPGNVRCKSYAKARAVYQKLKEVKLGLEANQQKKLESVGAVVVNKNRRSPNEGVNS